MRGGTSTKAGEEKAAKSSSKHSVFESVALYKNQKLFTSVTGKSLTAVR